jgi:hypothetical protein
MPRQRTGKLSDLPKRALPPEGRRLIGAWADVSIVVRVWHHVGAVMLWVLSVRFFPDSPEKHSSDQ